MNPVVRLATWVIALALVALPVVAVLRGWIGAEHWPLTRLRATGEFVRVDAAELQRTLAPYGTRGFFAVDLQAAQDAVAALPWVETARVRKRWPDMLEVHVVEHRPFARWGKDRLLSEHGRVFAARGALPDTLPQFDGPTSRVNDVVTLYNESRALFAPLGLDVRNVTIDPRGSWEITVHDRALDKRTQVVLGRNEARARLERFVRLMPQLMIQSERRIVRADLRYTNGFSLSWKALPAAATAPQQQGKT